MRNEHHPAWQWNEMQQVGTDYADAAEVERYDRRMSELRNVAAEDAAILDDLSLRPGARILEIGTGTGHFARAAAKAGHKVSAIDVSPAMLDYARQRAKEEGCCGAEFSLGGFLTHDFEPGTFDAAVSVAALHHLPDMWKAIALGRLHQVLKPGGRLLLRDVVFSWQNDAHAACFEGFVNRCPEGMRKEAARHIAREFSTLDWIMEGLLQHAGFRIVNITGGAPMVQYLCDNP